MRLVLLILTVFMATTSSAQAGDRFPLLTPEQLTPEQRKLAESLIAGGRGGGAEPTNEAVAALLQRGPFNAFMYSPELGNRLQALGEYARFQTSPPQRPNQIPTPLPPPPRTLACEWVA